MKCSGACQGEQRQGNTTLRRKPHRHRSGLSHASPRKVQLREMGRLPATGALLPGLAGSGAASSTGISLDRGMRLNCF